MKILKLILKNVLGHELLEFEAGKFNQITGANGTGKTSIIEAIKSTLQGGHDATLKRNGAKTGEVVIVLDDNMIITKQIGEESSNTTITQNGSKVSQPMTRIASFRDILGLNPAAFLTADDKQRMQMLLETVPTSVSAAQLREATGIQHITEDANGNALEVVQRYRKQVYEERRDVNRDVRQLQTTINQLQESLINVEEVESETLESLTNQIQELNNKRADALKKIADEKEQRIAQINQEYNQQVQELTAEFEERVTPLQQRSSALQAIQKQATIQQTTRDNIKQMQVNLERAGVIAINKEEALDRIDALYQGLLDGMPIEGMTLQEGKIYLDGVPFERINTARKVQFALKLAVLRAKGNPLKLICMDGMELLSTETYIAFVSAAKQVDDIQFFVTRVSDGQLTIEN